MWDYKEAEMKEREARIAWLKEHAPGFEAVINGLDMDHAPHGLVVAAGLIIRLVHTEQMVVELRGVVHCAIQTNLTKKPMKLLSKMGPEHEEHQKWSYLSALHAHRAAMILADRLGKNKIIKALIEMTDWYVAESVLWAALNAAEDDDCGEDD